MVIGTTGTETRFLPEAELPEYAKMNSVNPEEEHLSSIGGEDVGLAKAIEESVREQRKNKGGSSPNSSVASKRAKKD